MGGLSKEMGGRVLRLGDPCLRSRARSGPPRCRDAGRRALRCGRNPFSTSALPAPPEKAPRPCHPNPARSPRAEGGHRAGVGAPALPRGAWKTNRTVHQHFPSPPSTALGTQTAGPGRTDRQGGLMLLGPVTSNLALVLESRAVSKRQAPNAVCPRLAVLVSLPTPHRVSPDSAWHAPAALPRSPPQPGRPASHPPRLTPRS